MPGFGGLATAAAQLLALFVQSGMGGTYRRRFVATAAPTDWAGGPQDPPQPIGTRGAGYDPVEGAVLDSTVDANTGFVGAYAPGMQVGCVVKRGAADTARQQYGLQLQEDETWGVFLASDIAPAYLDLFIAADTQRYVIGRQIRPIVAIDTIIGYAAQLERRDPTDTSYTA